MAFCSWTKSEKYKDHFDVGCYVCHKCDHPLFSSQAKYAHDTPWPAFEHTINATSVRKRQEKGNAFKAFTPAWSVITPYFRPKPNTPITPPGRPSLTLCSPTP
ncbi:methionine-R-sulfoxide reductase B1-A-like isoform X5 [Tigriopus californicus]|uniref:methionine-R-sulfoxide reductase B1-A-like isoform X5 n=1 Tax=Tigriopus californicus TaxID=6832 RepID=UPI0027D9FD66|nr:methionine-R-sulfoxide reductase B1-A-like isoform X5 [Tigriopus californicus]